MLDRLRRVTDLFVEGAACYLGMDDNSKPILIWVNKLNSFETEEARRDGLTRRGERIMFLSKDDNPERLALQATIRNWSDEQLADARVGQVSEEIYLDVINEIEGEEAWREKVAQMRRLPVLLDDEKVPASDPRREELNKLNSEYLQEIRKRQEAGQKEKLTEFVGIDREQLEKDFFEAWVNRISLDEYMEEKRVTELFYAMRDCVATEKGRDRSTHKVLWDHTDCNHGERLLQERAQVRTLPEQVIGKVIDTLDDITVGQRESGNSDAPASSSASSERASEEADSTPSTPEEPRVAVPTTSAAP